MTIRKRLASLEADMGAGPYKDVRLMSLQELCRALAHERTAEELRADCEADGSDFPGLLQMIREHVPGYGAGL